MRRIARNSICRGGDVEALTDFLILLVDSLLFGMVTLLVVKLLEYYDPF